MEQVNLNIVPNGVKPVCHASQYDRGRQIRLNLYDGDSHYTLSGAETIELNVKKADGTIYTDSITNTESDYLVITTVQQMTAVSGENNCSIKITEGNTTIGTLNFTLNVEKSPLDDGDPSESFIYDLRQQIEDIISHMPPTGGGLRASSIELYTGTYTVVE